MGDRRNLDWKTNNVGSKLLAKMGWKDGQGVGKRSSSSAYNKNDREGCDDDGETPVARVSTEGIRVKRRQTNLGLGATAHHAALLATASGSNHADDFAKALTDFQKIHNGSGGDDDDDDDAQEENKARKKSSKEMKKKRKDGRNKEKQTKKKQKTHNIVLPTNKMTHGAIRRAKFQEKTMEDLKGIFAGSSLAVYKSTSTTTTMTNVEAMLDNKKTTMKRKRS
jgi:hypothetical protein